MINLERQLNPHSQVITKKRELKMIKKIIPLFFIFIQTIFSQSSFYIYTNKNILPDEEVQVQVSGYNLVSRMITFEIYRIKDPLKFISSTIDLLNFTDEAFNKISSLVELVSSSEKMVETNNIWFNQRFNLEKIHGRGTYIVRAINYKATAYSFFTCSEIGLISKRSVDEILIYVSNRKTSEPIPNLKLNLISLDKKIYSLRTDENGIVYQKIGNRPEDRKFIIALTENDTTILIHEPVFSPTDEYDKYLVYTYTSQPVYRPQQKVFFKSIVRLRDKDELSTPQNLPVQVKVLMPDNSPLFDSIFTTNRNGTINGSFEIPDDAQLGNYTISVNIENFSYASSFFVEEYKKPEYKVSVQTNKGNYSENDSVKIKVTAEYFFGEKLSEGKAKLLIYRSPLIRHWWEFEPYAKFYRGCFVDIIPYYQPELIIETEGKISNGELDYIFVIEKELLTNFEYKVVAYVKDESNREVMGTEKFYVTKYKVSVTTNPDRYFYPTNANAILKIITTDFSFKPVSKEFKVIIQKIHNYNFTDYYEDVDTLTGKTQSDGIAYVQYRVKESGRYSYLVIVEDENKTVTARGNFYVGDKNFDVSGLREGLQIIPSKDIYDENEELEFLIISPVKNINLLLTLEQSKIYDKRVIKLNGSSIVVKFKTKLPSITHISAGFYYDNQFYSSLKKIGILKNEKRLSVEIYSDKNSYKPGEKGKIKIKVKDYNGKPVKDAELSASIIDESIFSIRPELSENIFDFFNQSSIYKIYTSSMEIYSDYFYEQTREQRLLKQPQFFSFSRQGRSKITGRLINASTNEPLQKIELILIKDNKQLKASTDENGRFIFKSLSSGNYLLLINSNMFENKVIRIDDLKERSIRDLGVIRLFPIEISVPSIVDKDYILRGVNVLYKQSLDAVSPESEMDRLQGSALKEFSEPVIRKDFKDAIFWNPALTTDENGEANFEVKFPDNLTSWRNTIKAITYDSKSGENFSNVLVKKNLLIRVEVPRYIGEKDEISLPVLVHNYSDTEQLVRVQLDLKNGEVINDFNERMHQRIINPFTREEIIKPGEVLKTIWRIRVGENVDTLKITAKALVLKTSEQIVESDGVEISVPVEAQGIPIVIVKNFSLDKRKDSFVKEFEINNAQPKQKVILKLSPTLIGNILNSLDELVGYPYGCVEQTMSRFLPSIIVANLINELGINVQSKTFEILPEVVKSGLKRLKDFQHKDGGWGWWENDQTNPFMTAYVVYGLTLTKSAGFSVDQEMFNRGLEALRKFINDKMLDSRTRAYILFSLSEAQKFVDENNSDKNLIREKFNELVSLKKDPFVVSYLIQIANENGFKDEMDDLKKSLLKLAVIEGNMVYWGDESFAARFINDKVEITASALKSLIITGEKSNLIENGIRWLMYQKKGNFWMSTKQTATVIFSLVDYLKSSSELDADFSVDVRLNDKVVKSFKFTKQSIASNEIIIDLSSEQLKKGKNKLEISKSGKGKLYCSLIEKYFVNEAAESNQHFVVERKYYKLSYVKEGEKFEKKLSEVKDTIKVGERVFVEIKVKSNNDYEYFMLEDPLVPGFEYLQSIEEQGSFTGWYHHKELRDRRAVFFVTNYSRGEYTFSYLTYAQFPGVYLVPPSAASLMYYPDLRGIGKAKEIVIVE